MERPTDPHWTAALYTSTQHHTYTGWRRTDGTRRTTKETYIRLYFCDFLRINNILQLTRKSDSTTQWWLWIGTRSARAETVKAMCHIPANSTLRLKQPGMNSGRVWSDVSQEWAALCSQRTGGDTDCSDDRMNRSCCGAVPLRQIKARSKFNSLNIIVSDILSLWCSSWRSACIFQLERSASLLSSRWTEDAVEEISYAPVSTDRVTIVHLGEKGAVLQIICH